MYFPNLGDWSVNGPEQANIKCFGDAGVEIADGPGQNVDSAYLRIKQGSLAAPSGYFACTLGSFIPAVRPCSGAPRAVESGAINR
jgi:hypothetical protein